MPPLPSLCVTMPTRTYTSRRRQGIRGSRRLPRCSSAGRVACSLEPHRRALGRSTSIAPIARRLTATWARDACAIATISRDRYTFHTRALMGASSERSPAPTVHTVLMGRSAQRASTPVCRILAATSSQSIDAGWSVLFIATTTHERVFPRLFHLVYTNGPSALSAMSTVNSPRRRALCRRLRRARPA